MRIGILGAGLAGISLAERLQDLSDVAQIELLEKAPASGGLARSFPFGNVHYDCGPHIIFSKDTEVLQLMVEVLGDNVHKLRRSNRVFHDGRFVKYPFENELSALSQQDKNYALSAFLDNPYADYTPRNMLQFFLATFGEGITNLYLRPYNEKIWKFDPAFMDTQMVERIPRPPAEDIIRSAEGAETEGYVHQLFFHYPKTGGIQSLVDAFRSRLGPEVTIHTNTAVEKVEREAGQWKVSAADGTQRRYDRLVSTIPIPDLVESLGAAVPEAVIGAADGLRFNSIAICMVKVRRDNLDDTLALMVADKQIVFHRLTKINYLCAPESEDGTVTLQMEVTYRKGDLIDQLTDEQLSGEVIKGLVKLGFIDGDEDVLADELRRFQYAYVIYDLRHRRNTRTVRSYCEDELGIVLHGRFGEFEYLNMDAVIRRSIDRAQEIGAQEMGKSP